MRVLIAIPSKGRPYDIQKNNLKWLPKLKRKFEGIEIDWKFFVEPQEIAYYRQTAGRKRVVSVEDNDRGLGYAIRFMSEYAQNNQFDLIFRMDDDIRTWASKEIGDGKTGHSAEVLERMLVDVVPDFVAQPKLGLVRFISTKYHLFEMVGQQRKYTHLNDEVWGTNICRPGLSRLLPDEVTTSDDAVLTCYIIESGYAILTYGRCGLNAQWDNNPGGFQMLDRRRMTEDTFKFISRTFPKIRLRENTKWFGVDLDVSEYAPKIPLKPDWNINSI